MWGAGGGHHPPGRGGGGPPAQLAGEGRGHRGEVCVFERGRVGGEGARRRILVCAQALAAGRAGAQEEGPGGAGAVGRREGGQADAKGGGEPRRRRRRRARAIRGRRIRACARRGVSALEGSDACAFTCARESGKKRREA